LSEAPMGYESFNNLKNVWRYIVLKP